MNFVGSFASFEPVSMLDDDQCPTYRHTTKLQRSLGVDVIDVAIISQSQVSTLWQTRITMENHHVKIGKSTISMIFYGHVMFFS